MKFKGAKAIHYDSGPNMTPLVDIVMVILIFLMLTGSFGASAHFLQSSMPITASGKGQIDPKNIPKVPDPQLEIFVSSLSDDTFRARIGSGEYFTDADKLADALTLKRKQHEATGSSAEKMQIKICPRLLTRYNHVILVYQAAMKAEWPKIGFQAARD
ncbi:MAG TPA: biopolymer transporter ExbD [Tepidisphaeraceae bacterium]|jgi:biopolymer transport protein ExbD